MAKPTKAELAEAAKLAADRAQREAEVDNTPPPEHCPEPLTLVQKLRKVADDIERAEDLATNLLQSAAERLKAAKTADEVEFIHEDLRRLKESEAKISDKIYSAISMVGNPTQSEITFDFSKPIQELLQQAYIKLNMLKGN